MIKTFFILSALLFSSMLSGETNAPDVSRVTYFTKNSTVPRPDDFLVMIKDDSNKFKLKSSAVHLCGKLYQKDSKGNVSAVDVEKKWLTDFDFSKGRYTCTYDVVGLDVKPSIEYQIEYWDTVISGKSGGNDTYELFNGEFEPDDVDKISKGSTFLKKNRKKSIYDFSVYKFAKDIGVWTDDSSSFKRNSVTLSEFVSNLITLNSDYVTGVSANGDIIINPKISGQLSVLNNTDNQKSFAKTVGESIWSWLPLTTSSETKEALKLNLESISQIDYFDKKLFGLYYNFMNIAWGNIFHYAGTLFLLFLSLYLGGNLALKYGMHSLEPKETRGNFEFPIKARLVSVAMTLMITFIPFPSGEIAQSSSGDKINAETTIAKKLISYMANMGTIVADFSAGNVMTVYMDYLLKASNNDNVKDTIDMNIELRKMVKEQRIRTSFFQTACVDEYPYAYKQYSTFQELVGLTEKSDWNDIPTSWLKNESKPLFGRWNNIYSTKRAVSLDLCAQLEREIVINNKTMRILQNSISNSIGALDAFFSSNKTNSGNVFVMTQLTAVKDIGWYAIASLPILHVYLKNTELINIGEDIPHTGIGRTKISEAVINRTITNIGGSDKYSDAVEEAQETSKGEGVLSSINDGLKYIVSKQVYFMMPAFAEVFKASKEMAYSAVSLVSILPAGKIANFASTIAGYVSELKDTKETSGGMAVATGVLVTIIGFMIAVMLYNLMIKVIFAGVVALLIVVKILFYIIDVFIYYFVSPFVVGWQMTISNNTDKLHRYISNGFVLLVIKPSLIVFSTMMFIIGIELMHSVYFMMFDIVYSSVELANAIIGGTLKEDSFGLTGFLIMANLKGIGEIFVDIVGLILAYKLIMDGDKMILDKFGYRDDTESSISSQVSEKIQTVAGKI